MAAMENTWQQKKQDITKSIKNKYGNTEKAQQTIQYLNYKAEMEQIRENQDLNGITAKIQSGAALTPEEIAYLKEKNPKAYQAYEEAKREEKAYEKQLENCDTKEDVEKLEQVKMGEFMAQLKEVASNSRIPESEKLALVEKIHAKAKRIQKVHEKFVKSTAYLNLPSEEEEREKEEASGNTVQRSPESPLRIDSENQNTMQEEYGNDVSGDVSQPEKGSSEEIPEKATYQQVAEKAKEYITNNRQTGAGLEMILSIQDEYENIVKKD